MNKKGVSRKNLIDFVLICGLALSIIFISQFVIAGTVIGTINVTNRSGSQFNFTDENIISANQNVTYIYNFSISHISGMKNITRINITLWGFFNFTAGSNGTGNISTTTPIYFSNTADQLSWNATTADTSLINSTGHSNYTFLWFNLTAGTPGKYNITVRFIYDRSEAFTNLLYNETNVTVVVNDSIAPYMVNFSIYDSDGYFISHSNWSGNLLLNVTAKDMGITTNMSVIFNLTNMSGSQVATYAATNLSTSNNYWSYSLDTSGIADGVNYNITAWVRDGGGNINNSISVGNLTFDNTAPSGTLTCTPTDDIYIGGTVTCACTATDGLSGLNLSRGTSGKVYNATPTTTDSGEITQTCYFSDYAGNTGTATATYTVWGTTTSGGSSGGTSGGTSTTSVSTVSQITAASPATVSNFASGSGVSEIQVQVTSTASNVKITVNKYESAPAAVTVTLDNAYKYLQINTQNLADKLSKATVKTYVEKSWVDSQGIAKEDVSLYKYDEVADQWNELTTTYASEDATYYYYTSEVTSFSYFGIAPASTAVVSGGETPTPTPTPEPTAIPLWVWIVIGAVILAAIIGGGVVLGKKKRK